MAKLDARLELRLNRHTYLRLEQRAAATHTSVADLVRRAIERELVEEGAGRREMLEKGLSLDVPVPGDPAELARELDAGYEAGLAAVADPSAELGQPTSQSCAPASRRRR